MSSSSSSVYNVSTSENTAAGSTGGAPAVYPRSRASQSANSESVIRSRTWSEDITKNWNEQITGLETIAERVNRYILYFTLTTEQLKVLVAKLTDDMKMGLEEHHRSTGVSALGGTSSAVGSHSFETAPVSKGTGAGGGGGGGSAASCSGGGTLKMLDTYITQKAIPRGNELGEAVALDFSNSEVIAAKVIFEGGRRISFTHSVLNLRDDTSKHPQGLLDKKATATELFDCLCDAVNQISKAKVVVQTTKGPRSTDSKSTEDLSHAAAAKGTDDSRTSLHDDAASETSVVSGGSAAPPPLLPLGFCVGFPCDQRSLDSATLIHWCKGFQTGRSTDDPVESMDVAALLDCAMWRRNVPCKTRAVANDATAMLIAASYELPSKLPPVRMALVVGAGVNGCYVQPEAIEQYEYVGDVINCEIGDFDKSLPVNDVDLEVDFADQVSPGRQLFEKMVATSYLGELCRRLIVKVWENEAPPLAWVRYSMPWLACARVLEDETPELSATAQILHGLWEWETAVEERRAVQKLFEVVFNRSAALAAVSAIALASSSGRLQAAMGGLTCAVGGVLLRSVPLYAVKMRKYLDNVMDQDTAKLIHFQEVEFGPIKGAALLAACKTTTTTSHRKQ